MRQLASFDQQATANRFSAYLITIDIESSVDGAESKWSIWVRDEDRLELALAELEKFRNAPDDARYRKVESKAEAIQLEKQESRRKAHKNIVKVGNNWSRGPNRKTPLVMTLTIISVIVFLGTDLGKNWNGKFGRALLFKDPVSSGSDLIEQQKAFGAVNQDALSYRLYNIKAGQIWRAITPIFIHAGFLHIALNMFWLFRFGPQIESKIGTVKFGLLVLWIAVISNVLQGVVPTEIGGSAGDFGGMSGVVYGVFGFVWIKSQIDPWSGYQISQATVFLLLIMMMVQMTGVMGAAMGRTANWCHGAGLVAGIAAAYLPLLLGLEKKGTRKK